MNPGFTRLHPYPFEKLAALRSKIDVPADRKPINLSIGEPKHETPAFILETLAGYLSRAAEYPKTAGRDELREAIARWLCHRFRLPESSLDPDRHILPVNGTREALFAIAQCVIDYTAKNSIVVIPNPFYQIYEGAALLAGAQPWYLNQDEETAYVPDFSSVPEKTWQDCQLIYICSPGNPAGSVIGIEALQELLDLADRYDFIIAADECYSEIYLDEDNPPPGLLQAAAASGRNDYRRCLVFHSLSKRSNVPGMRSGFVAGNDVLIRQFLRYRTYHGCAMPGFIQEASIRAWQDEDHVSANRKLYREKFAAVLDILQPVINVRKPEGGFYLWPELRTDDVQFAAGLLAKQNLTVLPGSFLSRSVNGTDPGANHLRIALVASLDECVEAAGRIREYINNVE